MRWHCLIIGTVKERSTSDSSLLNGLHIESYGRLVLTLLILRKDGMLLGLDDRLGAGGSPASSFSTLSASLFTNRAIAPCEIQGESMKNIYYWISRQVNRLLRVPCHGCLMVPVWFWKKRCDFCDVCDQPMKEIK